MAYHPFSQAQGLHLCIPSCTTQRDLTAKRLITHARHCIWIPGKNLSHFYPETASVKYCISLWSKSSFRPVIVPAARLHLKHAFEHFQGASHQTPAPHPDHIPAHSSPHPYARAHSSALPASVIDDPVHHKSCSPAGFHVSAAAAHQNMPAQEIRSADICIRKLLA